jgi:outer membrane murein-binding lipoprotein Lpp
LKSKKNEVRNVSGLKRFAIISLAAIVAGFSLSGCASNVSEGSPSEQSEVSSLGDQENNYLSDLDAVDPDAFASEESALLYLKNYCQVIANGSTPKTPDAIDSVVASYCGTELSSAVGVTPAPTPPEGVDTEEFAKIALERWGVGLPEADGSAADPVQWGMSVCEVDIDMMLSNLGEDFEGSFQEYSLETFCPELLP